MKQKNRHWLWSAVLLCCLFLARYAWEQMDLEQQTVPVGQESVFGGEIPEYAGEAYVDLGQRAGFFPRGPDRSAL